MGTRPVTVIACVTAGLVTQYLQSWTSLGTLAFLDVFQFTQAQPLPSPHKQCWTRVSRIFPLYRVRGEGNCRKISKRMRCFMREPRMTEKYEYCITVPRTFVHNCR